MKEKIRAFTILEVSIVLVLVGIITSIVFKGISMFEMQLSKDANQKQELSEFYIFRANLYQDILSTEKYVYDDSKVTLIGERSIQYSKSNGKLERKFGNQITYFDYEVNELGIKKNDLDSCFYLNIEWKESELEFIIPLIQSKSQKINTYFTNFERR